MSERLLDGSPVLRSAISKYWEGVGLPQMRELSVTAWRLCGDDGLLYLLHLLHCTSKFHMAAMQAALQASCALGRLGDRPSTSGRAVTPQQQLHGALRQQQRRRQQQAALTVVGALSAEAAAAPPSTPVLPRGGRGPASDPSAPLSPMDKVLFPDIQLPLYDPAQPRTFDVVVVGSGPAGLAVADRVAAAGFQVRLLAVQLNCSGCQGGAAATAGWNAACAKACACAPRMAAIAGAPPPPYDHH